MSTKTPPTPKKKDSNPNAAAAELRALRAKKDADRAAKASKNTVNRIPKKKPARLPVADMVAISKEAMEAIIANRVTMSEDGSMVISKDTPIDEFVHLLGHVESKLENAQWALGELVVQGREIYGTSFEELMARFGRPISTLKNYSATVQAFPPRLRNLHEKVKFTHYEKLKKLNEEDRESIILNAVKQAKKGHALTVREIGVIADKKKPRRAKKPSTKPKKSKVGKDKPDLEMNALEKEMYDELEEIVIRLDRCIEGVPFVLDMSSTQTATLREKLERIARFYTQIS